MRKLATIRTIAKVSTHANADRLAVYTVDGWQVIDLKDRYEVGDSVIYCEIDSFLPIRDEFEFLRKSSYKKMGVLEGFRLKTIRLRGELSQGLLIHMSVLPKDQQSLPESTDVTELLGIIQYEKPVPTSLEGKAKGAFPSFMPKTDEERIQNLDYHELQQYSYSVSEKLDGTSMTLFCNKGEIGVCSRNWELLENMDNSLWRAAHANGLADKLKQLGRNLAIQGELIGLSIQKNIYHLNEIKLMVFRILDINNREFLPREEMVALCQQLGVDTVPLLQNDLKLPGTMHEAIISADGSSELHDTDREGLVFYAHENSSVHFKIVSNQFLERTAG